MTKKREKKFFETSDSFRAVDMIRCLITEGHSVRVQVIQRAPITIFNNNLYVIYQEYETEDEDE